MINLWRSIINKGGSPTPPESDTVIGTPLGVYNTNGMSISSSIDSITNISAKTVYDTGLSNMPLMLLIHGWGDNYNAFEQATYERFASYKFFVVGIGMRMRLGADGVRDISAREVYDIYDHIAKAHYQFGSLINKSKTFAVGYSNGGGLVLSLGSKFPDTFSLLVDHFGISDHGYSDTKSWYITNPLTSYTDPMDLYVGSPRTSYKNEYLSRETRTNFGKNFTGKLRIYHDEDDSAVNIDHSELLVAQLDSDGFTNYVYSKTTAIDSPRWIHEYPNGSAGVISAESEWTNEALTLLSNDIPTSGTFLIHGYITTKKFKIWLGDGVTSSKDGTNRNASLVYDVSNNSYTITPILESGATDMEVRIYQYDGKSATQIISIETEIIVS